MKTYGKVLWMTVSFFTLLIFACVTINIYFPAEKVESVAAEIVDEIRDQKPSGKDSHLLKGTFFAFMCPSAWADQALTVSNPTIRALKQKMKARYPKMKPYYQKGVLKEGGNGYVSIGNMAGLGLKAKRDLKSLVSAENGDRKKLYGEIAKALKIDASQVNRVAEIFAKEWQKPVRQASSRRGGTGCLVLGIRYWVLVTCRRSHLQRECWMIQQLDINFKVPVYVDSYLWPVCLERRIP